MKRNGTLKKDGELKEIERVQFNIPQFREGKIEIKKGDVGEVLESVPGPNCSIKVKFKAGTVIISRFWTRPLEEDLEELIKRMGREMRKKDSSNSTGSSMPPWM